jgi:arylsulfatase
MVGKVGLYKDGWFLSGDDGRLPWENRPPASFDPAGVKWELYDLRSDFSQSDDVSGQHPDQLKDMLATWKDVAAANNVFPLEHRFGSARIDRPPPAPRKHYDYWGNDISLPAMRGPMFAGRSYTLNADVQLSRSNASGVIFAVGSRFAGFSLFLEEGRPHFVYALSTRPQDVTRIASQRSVQAGEMQLQVKCKALGPSKGADVQLLYQGNIIASGHVPQMYLVPAGNGELLNTGRDTGVTVTRYRTPHGELEGEVRHISVDFE